MNLVNKMLTDEAGTASNIKSRVNRQSVLDAIGSAQTRLKRYSSVPANGLIIYCGTVLTDEGKEKKLNIDFEPFKPINTSLYLCDNKFHTEALSDLLQSDNKYGFIVMDGHGTLFGTLAGNHREILHKVSVDLPKKHGRGGQSALRFARLRLEKRQNYVRKIMELTTQHFITNDKPNVNGLVLAGSADFKNQLTQSDLFDIRLQPIILIDCRRLLRRRERIQPGDRALRGLPRERQVRQGEASARQILRRDQPRQQQVLLRGEGHAHVPGDGRHEICIVWENLEVNRHVLLNKETGEEHIVYLTPEQEKDDSNFKDKETGVDLESTESGSMLEWLNEYKKFGCQLEFVTDRSEEGSQFVQGFGGIGGILRYQVDPTQFEVASDVESGDDDSSDDEGYI